MIEFTKEELEELLMWSNYLAGCNTLLIKKIQFMIHNYKDMDFSNAPKDLKITYEIHKSVL